MVTKMTDGFHYFAFPGSALVESLDHRIEPVRVMGIVPYEASTGSYPVFSYIPIHPVSEFATG